MDLIRAGALLERTYSQGTTVTNCVIHLGLAIDRRPSTCELCWYDMKNLLSRALAANQWLNDWKDEAEKILKDAFPKDPARG